MYIFRIMGNNCRDTYYNNICYILHHTEIEEED